MNGNVSKLRSIVALLESLGRMQLLEGLSGQPSETSRKGPFIRLGASFSPLKVVLIRHPGVYKYNVASICKDFCDWKSN